MLKKSDGPSHPGTWALAAAISMSRNVPIGILALILFVSASVARAQVFQVGGGSSSLFQASGGSVEVHAQNYEGWFGIGSLDGRTRLGASMSEHWRGSMLTFGDDIIPFHLPTDIFDDSHYFLGRGAGIALNRGGLTLLAFGGATATGFNAPFFRAASAENGVGVFFLEDKITPKIRLFSRNIVSNLQTTINGAEWQPKAWLKSSLAGGIGANQDYLASSIAAEKPWVTLKAAYILAGNQFRRIVVQTPLNSEPDRGNILLTLHPKPFLDFTAGRFNLLEPSQGVQPGIRATVDQFSASALAARFRFGASLFKSYVRGTNTEGTSLSVGRDFAGRIQASAYFLHSRSPRLPSSTSVLSMFREVFSPRFSLLQSVNHSAGHTSVSFGGNFLSNPVSVGVEYQTVYSPFRIGNPFHQVLLLNLRFQPFGTFSANVGSYVAPDGSVKYTAYGQNFLYRGETASNRPRKFGLPHYIIRGRVVDEDGQPLDGAALRIDGDLVFTNSRGEFFLRRKRARPCAIEVVLDQFLVPGAFALISSPTVVEPSPEEAPIPIVVTLRRRVAIK